MKKITVPLAAVILGLTLFGCGQSSVSDVTVESFPAITTAMIRFTDSPMMNIPQNIDTIAKYLDEQNYFENNPARVICVAWSWEKSQGDWGIGFIIDPEAGIEGTDEIEIIDFPALEQAATAVYTGPYMGVTKGYNAITTWIEDNGYEYCYPSFEEYLNDPSEVSPSELETKIWTGIK